MEDFDVTVDGDDQEVSFAAYGQEVDETMLAFPGDDGAIYKKKQPKWGAYRTMGTDDFILIFPRS